MKHLKKGRKLSRKRDQRKALLRNLAYSLILREKIKTTEAKAKELRPFVEKIITKAKKRDLNSRRHIAKLLAPNAVKKVVDELGERYAERKGGYIRIIKMGFRRGDAARMAIIELVK